MGRPSLITGAMEDFIRGELIKEPRPHADTIVLALRENLESQGLFQKNIPGDDAVIKRITKLKKEVDAHPPSELDTPFTTWACLKYNIPLTPALLEAWAFYLDASESFTIRQARWFTLLYPVLEPILKAKCPREIPAHCVAVIAQKYRNHELIAEVAGGHHSATSWLDKHYLIDGDVVVKEHPLFSYPQNVIDEGIRKMKESKKGR